MWYALMWVITTIMAIVIGFYMGTDCEEWKGRNDK